MNNPLATIDDYTLLIGPVGPGDEPRLEALLMVSSSVVVGVAPGLLPWWTYDSSDPDAVDPGPVPEPAVLVTCQTASNMATNPAGAGGGAVQMERVGLAETTYAASTWDTTYGLLPAAWRLLLKPWRPPDLASVKLSVPHPAMYEFEEGYGGDWWWWPGLIVEESAG